MVARKRKKVVKYRGSKTHGGGSMKKRRGAGHRGGRGRAGSGAKGDAKKPSYQKAGKKYMGKHGFTSIGRKKINAINISDLQTKLDSYVSKKLVLYKTGAYVVDLTKLGYNKLLGTGKTSVKWDITTDYASKRAIEKIEKAGGKISVAFEPSEEDEFEPAQKEPEVVEAQSSVAASADKPEEKETKVEQ
ncbi:50S ribosomal protein L15 [Candidatus Woesearchaeota archaeon]|nr:50S ribosomal protein L15 [Candidatus Woesearchaeota archaeon]